MTKRSYSMETRAAHEAETRERIVRAAVRLHADKGALHTPFAAIAKRAQVSPQTVYNHFPDLGALLGACTGHVEARAPSVDETAFRGGRTAEERLRRFARAVYARVEFFAPWLRLGYHEAAFSSELAAIFAAGDDDVRRLAVAALAPDREPAAGFVDAAFVLLDYPAWKTLTRERSTAEAARLAGDGLADLVPRLTRPTRLRKDPA
jgi:AcrR family transcriptional regulator